VEVVLLCVLFVDAVTLRMLPDITLFACNRVCAVVVVLAMLATNGAIEDPFTLLFGQGVQLFLSSFHLRLKVTL
jgi:hypothetical protein